MRAVDESFVLSVTTLKTPPLCPEVRLLVADEVMPLWEATEAYMAEEGLPPPYWAFSWPGSQALARWLLDNPGFVRGRRVLDFGAGCGLAAIAAHLAGASEVLAADIDPFALTAIRMNASLNGAELTVVRDDLLGTPPGWDVITAGDVCYERSLADPLLCWLREMTRSGVTVLLADPGRAYAPRSGFTELASYRVPTTMDLEGSEQRDVSVCLLD